MQFLLRVLLSSFLLTDRVLWTLEARIADTTLSLLCSTKIFKNGFLYALFLQEDKDFDEVMDEESGDEAEGVEADTTMTLQGGVSKDW